ncbi:unnamed protein product [Ilex paraguariensis]|uniref:Translocator protein homolog n=1 Tax=Ilex paraguariensis TaxID=185542 RepID=A0ABC8RL76_9AQUA
MASPNLQHRFKDNVTTTSSTASTTTNPISTTAAAKTRQQKKMAMAKQAVRSLMVALIVPFVLTMIVIFFFGSGHRYRTLAKPFWFPPLWLMHLASMGSSLLMGLAAWLVWAEGGFHSQPKALPFYIAQVSLSLGWDPLVLKMGAIHVGFVSCIAHFGALVACRRRFKLVNPIAGDLVRPCLVWMAFLIIVNFKLVFF